MKIILIENDLTIEEVKIKLKIEILMESINLYKFKNQIKIDEDVLNKKIDRK